MVEATDIENLLTTGAWSTQRAKTPRPSTPVRANRSFRLDPLDPRTPRSIPVYSSRYSGFPPPPSVEDEAESLAKEYDGSAVSIADEEPKCRGDVEQQPIILTAAEDSDDRRYVLLTPSEADEGSHSDSSHANRKSKSSQNEDYAANTKVQLDPKDAQPRPQRRRSRAELPRLETHVSSTRPKRPTSVYRTMSATCVDQKLHTGRDYFSPHPESARPAGNAFMSPVIKHATKGRDKAYWNFNTGANDTISRSGAAIDPKSDAADRRGSNGSTRSSQSASPAVQRRTNSAMELPREARRIAERSISYREEMYDRARRSELPSPSLDRSSPLRSKSTRRERSPTRSKSTRRDRSPARSKSRRREHSPARSHREQPKLSRRKSSHKSRPSPPRDDETTVYSSDESRDSKRHRSHRQRRKSTVIQEDRPLLPSPGVASVRSKSRGPSPVPVPKSARAKSPDCKHEANPRSSTSTFNVARDKRRKEIERPISPMSSESSSSSRSRSRQRIRTSSQTPSIRSNASITKTANAPEIVYGSTPLPMAISRDDRRRPTMPPSPAYSRQGSLEEVHRQNHHWQPEPLIPTPRQSASSLQQPPSPVVSFRRFSEDVSTGAKPGLPDCPRQRPRAGYSDWLTLPRSENFNICPSCYEQVFYPTEFRDLFIPASSRSRDREIACDLGTSAWYRSAWLMTLKYGRSDLRLLQGVADVLTREKIPCYGNKRVSRVWYSITDPNTRRCIPDFHVCSPCARAVEVLFPSLMGIFVPLGLPVEPKSGKCSMHFTPTRNRFLTYFDVFEKCHDRAMEERSAPDSKRLAFNINFWSEVEECPRDQPLRHGYWYTMADIPEMTACEECFLDVVYPELVADAGARAATGSEDKANSAARNFYHKPYHIRGATVCQMASPWMRQLFKTACRRDNGLWYMDEKVRGRLGSI